MQLNEKNLREKDFHNNLQSKKMEDLRMFFIKLLLMLGPTFLNI